MSETLAGTMDPGMTDGKSDAGQTLLSFGMVISRGFIRFGRFADDNENCELYEVISENRRDKESTLASVVCY